MTTFPRIEAKLPDAAGDATPTLDRLLAQGAPVFVSSDPRGDLAGRLHNVKAEPGYVTGDFEATPEFAERLDRHARRTGLLMPVQWACAVRMGETVEACYVYGEGVAEAEWEDASGGGVVIQRTPGGPMLRGPAILGSEAREECGRMPDGEAMALGRRAAAAAVALRKAKRVRDAWLSGMLVRYGDRQEPHDVSRIGGEDGRGTSRPIDGSPWWPDLRDPATLGCLLALVREAHNEPRIHTMEQWTGSRWIWGVKPPWINYPMNIGETEAEALVAALEAAP